MMEFFQSLIEWTQSINPVFVMPAVAILPLFGFPVSALLIMAGYYYGPWYGMVVSLIGIAINDTLAYWLARTFMRGPILRFLEKRKVKVPDIPKKEEIRVIALIRITPGAPLFIQNYLLGLANVNFARYMLVSVPIQAIHAAGFVVFGGAIFEGKTGTIIFAVFFMIALVIILRVVHSQNQARAAKKAAS
ncbi:MAG: VTT domain-containing protein [Verrucomicrobiota bacterium]